MWNQRYCREEYVYGTEPNTFLAENAALLAAPVLSLAEGEGRNAVFLAMRGLDVTGVDSSEVGLGKARALAETRGVTIHTVVADLTTYEPEEAAFGSVVSIWAHLPTKDRRHLHEVLARALKPGGIFLLEAYAKTQIHRDTGGPRDADLLVSRVDLEMEFPDCDILLSQEIVRDVVEGAWHTGPADVVQFIARKRA